MPVLGLGRLGDAREDFLAAIAARNAARSPDAIAAHQVALAAERQAGAAVSAAAAGEVDEYGLPVVLPWPSPPPLSLRRITQAAADALHARVRAHYAQAGVLAAPTDDELMAVKQSIRRSIEQYRTGRPAVEEHFTGNPPGWKSDYFQWPSAYYTDLNDAAAFDAVARSWVKHQKDEAADRQHNAMTQAVIVSFAMAAVGMVGGAVLAPAIGAEAASAAASAPGVLMRAGEAAARNDWAGFAEALATAGVNVVGLPGGALSPIEARVASSAIHAGAAAARGDWSGMGMALASGALAVSPIDPGAGKAILGAAALVRQGVALQDQIRRADLASDQKQARAKQVQAGLHAVGSAVTQGGHPAAIADAAVALADANAGAAMAIASTGAVPAEPSVDFGGPPMIALGAIALVLLLFRR